MHAWAGVMTMLTLLPGCCTRCHQSSSITFSIPCDRNHAPSRRGTYLRQPCQALCQVHMCAACSKRGPPNPHQVTVLPYSLCRRITVPWSRWS